jgi:transposase-like protein
MAVDTETKREIIELYFNQRKNIREVAKEVKKSSRDVVAVVKDHKQKLRLSESSIHVRDNVNQQEKIPSTLLSTLKHTSYLQKD